MGKFVGLAGAVAAFGAVAYLLAPLPPPSETVVAAARTSPAPIPQSASDPRPATTTASAPPARPTREKTVSLVHQIQAELQRLGCYSGEIDGRWSETTQRAMQELGERVSVLRPVDTPDYIMLALARDQDRQVCSQRQRATAARALTSVTPTAGTVRKEATGTPAPQRSSTASRATAPEPARTPQASVPQPPRTAPEAPARRAAQLEPAEAARAAAAREELARLDARTPVVTRSTVDPLAAQAATDQAPVTPAAETLERSRMGLGVVNVDPLRAGIDPRDPTAPAILRGPSQPAPVTTAHVGGPVEPSALPPQPPGRTAPIATQIAPAPTAKQQRRVWQRGIFVDMQRNGP